MSSERFLQALRRVLSGDVVREYGEHLYRTLEEYLQTSVQGTLDEIDTQSGLEGFEFQVTDSEGDSGTYQTKDDRSYAWEVLWPSKLTATKIIEIDPSVLIRQLKTQNQEIKERPLDVVLKDREVQDAILSAFIQTIEAVDPTTKLGGKVTETADAYISNHLKGTISYTGLLGFAPKFQSTVSGERKLESLDYLKFRVSFYINVQMKDTWPDQGQKYAGNYMKMSSLRKKVIRLAYTRPDLRPRLLPILKAARAKELIQVLPSGRYDRPSNVEAVVVSGASLATSGFWLKPGIYTVHWISGGRVLLDDPSVPGETIEVDIKDFKGPSVKRNLVGPTRSL